MACLTQTAQLSELRQHTKENKHMLFEVMVTAISELQDAKSY